MTDARAERRTWSPGATVGPYEITSFIAAGGMGEVYAARDHRLGRDVAIKIVSERFSSDTDRLRRFEQEARAAGRLNHPNVLTLFDVGLSGNLPYIVTELLDGRTLRTLIHERRLSLAEALDIGVQIARGLAAAHAKGIIHRDLKPSNIFVGPERHVKIVDFGLAKLMHPEWEHASADDQTISRVSTPGEAVGSVGYMSPEQAQGASADHRTDFFSLGAILYEMVTGERAFHAASSVETMHAVLKEKPALLDSIEPAALARIIRRCLAKSPDDRYGLARELITDLEELRDQTHSGSSMHVRSRLSRRVKLLIAAGIVAVVWLGTNTLLSGRQSVPAGEPAPRPQMSLERLPRTDRTHSPAISPDGKFALYALMTEEGASLWRRELDTQAELQLIPPGTFANFASIAYSGDGRSIYFIASKDGEQFSTLHQVSAFGGLSTQLVDGVEAPVTVSRDGASAAFVDNSDTKRARLTIVTLNGRGREVVLERPHQAGLDSPSWSPDGSLLAFVQVVGEGASASRGVSVIDVRTKEHRLVGLPAWGDVMQVEWAEDGSGIVVLGTRTEPRVQVWLQPYPAGEPRRITNDLTQYVAMSVSAGSPTMLAQQNELQTNAWVAPGGVAERARQITTGVHDVVRLLAVTDDRRIVYPSSTANLRDIWIMDEDGTHAKPLTSRMGANIHPAVTPDDRFIFFSSGRTGTAHIWKMKIDGSDPVQITDGPGEIQPAVSPDGRFIVFVTEEEKGRRLFRTGIDGGTPVRMSEADLHWPSISPDGRHVACFERSDDGRQKIVVLSMQTFAREKEFSTVPGRTAPYPLDWTPDGNAITYIATQDGVSNLWNQPLAGGGPEQLTHFQSQQLWGFDWSRGGDLFYSRGDWVIDLVLIRNFH